LLTHTASVEVLARFDDPVAVLIVDGQHAVVFS
jgi:hypothetical protein